MKKSPGGLPKRMRKLEIVYVSPSKLKPWKKNPRRNDRAAEKLERLLDQFGFLVPIVATRDGTIRAGHTRYKAAVSKGDKLVPVIYVDFESEEEAELFSLADNKSSEWAEWDTELLSDVFAELQVKVSKAKLRTSGFTPMEIDGLEEPLLSETASDSLEDAIRQFEREDSKGKDRKYMIWFAVNDQEQFDALIEKYGSYEGKGGLRYRELDWNLIKRRLA
jgi:hypothetical protein